MSSHESSNDNSPSCQHTAAAEGVESVVTEGVFNPQDAKSDPNQNQDINPMSIDDENNNGSQDVETKPLSPQQRETWAQSLIGRWWEVYWDPDGENDDPDNQHDDDPSNQSSQPDPQQQQPSQETTPPQIQKLNVLYTTSRLGLSLQQIQIPTSLTTLDPQMIQTINTYRSIKAQSQPNSYILIKSLLPDAANGHLLRVYDVITGINGNSFYDYSNVGGGGGDFFNRVVNQLRDAKRPMIVNFDRVCAAPEQLEQEQSNEQEVVKESSGNTLPPNYRKPSKRDLSIPPETASDLPSGWTLRRIPRSTGVKACDIYYYSPAGYKFRSRKEVSRYLTCLTQTNDEEKALSLFRLGETKNHVDVDEIPLNLLPQKRSRDEDESEEEEDAVDWYDAKILSFEDGEFVVYFLGDEDGITYTMPLNCNVVRPSVRAWGVRSRALVDCRLDLRGSGDFERWVEEFRSSLPPSTELPGDWDDFKTPVQEGEAEISCSHRKIQEFGKMIAMQLHLAKRISPAEEGADEEGDEATEPGPFINSFQVEALCDYLTEVHQACKWLLSEGSVLRCLSTLNSSSGAQMQTKISQDTILSFLVNGARVLHRLMRADAEFLRGTSGKKKPRLNTSDHRITVESSFDQMLQSALFSDGSLAAVISTITAQYSEKSGAKCMESIVHGFIDQVYNLLHKPIMDWIKTADDIVGEKSQSTYSISDIEKHISDADSTAVLRAVDLSPWTVKLEAMLSRSQFFEMETWSAIKACIILNISRDSITSTESVNVGGGNDACFAALQRLKRESTLHPMKNVDPLGKDTVSSEGVQIPSLLTRSVIDDAITIRLWVLDLMQAKLVRERSSFIEDVIRRFSALPKLPAPPFSGFDGSEAQPSALLAENTKDSITILSANCYSYNHIIGNIGANLNKSVDNTANEMQLTTKTSVASALVELKRLPILSVVEEKLCLREELLDWNSRALQTMLRVESEKTKLPQQIEQLFIELVNIVDLKSEGRKKVCQNLRPNKSVDSEIRLFAIDDESLICPVTAKWVREQYSKAVNWKKSCDSILQVLDSNGFFSDEAPTGKTGKGGLIDLEYINQIWEQHNDDQFASSYPEFERLTKVREKISVWSAKFDQTLTSDALTFRERCNQLTELKHSRPKGVAVKPTLDSICLWLRLFSWPLNVHEKIKLLDEQMKSVPGEARNGQLMNLIKTNLASVIVEGQMFLLNGKQSSSMCKLRNEAINVISAGSSSGAVLNISELLGSTCHAKVGLKHMFDTQAEDPFSMSLAVLRILFWKIMIKCFLQHISNAEQGARSGLNGMVNRENAKTVFSLCPRSSDCTSVIIEDKSDETMLETLIRDADDLHGRATAILSHTSDLLRDRCFTRRDEIKLSLEGLTSLQSDFESNPRVSLLLAPSQLMDKISLKVDVVQWLLSTMAYPILWGDLLDENGDGRIPLDKLADLFSAIPLTVSNSQPELSKLDPEVVRMLSLVKNLIGSAKQWQESWRSLLEDGGSKIVELYTLRGMAQASILSMIVLPNESRAQETFQNARLMKESLETKLLSDEKFNGTDVYKGKFPEEGSLVGNNGDFLLYRLTGSEIYVELRQVLRDLKTASDQLTIVTAEKAAYQWVLSIYEWIEALNAAVICGSESQLVINVENARRLLEQGHDVLYGVADEVQDALALKQISIRANPEKYSIIIMKGGAMNSPGGSLLRWAALLFEGLRADVKREGIWRESTEKIISSFPDYELGNKNISSYVDRVKVLVNEAKSMFVRDGKLVGQLLYILDRVMKSEFLKKRLDDEVAAAEKERFDLELIKYEGPPLVNKRYDLLDCISFRRSFAAKREDQPELPVDDIESLFAGEPSARDKSRHFLQKSLVQGFEIFGMKDHKDAQDYCNVIAFNLEQAIFDKFKTDESGQNASSEYREKVRSLRFNLQDPKNPMLCARVLSGQLRIEDLIEMSTDELASKELNSFRQQMQQESTRNIVLSGPAVANERSSPSNETNWSAKIKIESPTIKRSKVPNEHKLQTPESPIPQSLQEQTPEAQTLDVPPPPFFKQTFETQSLDVPPPPSFNTSAALPRHDDSEPWPAPVSSCKIESVASSQSNHLASQVYSSHDGHHITAQSGTDYFLITISRLKLSFTTKLFIENSCPYQMDGFLPSSLTEKGRITLDEFNKFISEKMRGGRWNIVHLKLSSIGESDMNAYKRLYKEYESLDRICMINVNDSTKVFLVTPKFLRVCKCMAGVQNLSRSSTYAVVLTKDRLCHPTKC